MSKYESEIAYYIRLLFRKNIIKMDEIKFYTFFAPMVHLKKKNLDLVLLKPLMFFGFFCF